MILIAVPCWNNLWYTRRMVESAIRNSEGHEIEFVFVNNGSSDETAVYLYSLPPRGIKAHIINNSENKLVNYAWNQLMEYALTRNPEIIVLANNDILCGPRWLDAPIRELAKDDKRYFLPNGDFYNETTFEHDVLERLSRLSGTLPARAGWCFFFRPNAIPLCFPIPDRIRLWYGDDWIHWKLEKNGYKCEHLADSCCFHYISRSVNELPNKIQIIEEDRKAFTELTANNV